MTMPAKESIPTRSALLTRLREPDDAAAWEEFCATYGGLIQTPGPESGPAGRRGGGRGARGVRVGEPQYRRVRVRPDAVLVQTLAVADGPVADRRFSGEAAAGGTGGLLGGTGTGAGSEEQEAGIPAELEAVWDAEWRRNQLEVATNRLKNVVEPQKFQIFYLHVLNQMPVTDVARRLHVSVAQVYLTKFRVGKRFRQLLRAVQEAEEVGVGRRRLLKTLNAQRPTSRPPGQASFASTFAGLAKSSVQDPGTGKNRRIEQKHAELAKPERTGTGTPAPAAGSLPHHHQDPLRHLLRLFAGFCSSTYLACNRGFERRLATFAEAG